jgi:hypothetical protein
MPASPSMLSWPWRLARYSPPAELEELMPPDFPPA